MTGSDEFLPIMADCERGLGRPERAIDLVRSPEAERLDRAGRIELAIVESGARRDLGQHDAAVITLQRVPELRSQEPRPWSARLAFAYADALAEAGHEEAATDWFERAMAFDEDGETDAAERYAELTGAVIEDIEEEDEEDVLPLDDSGDVVPAEAEESEDEPSDDAGETAPSDVEETDVVGVDVLETEPETGTAEAEPQEVEPGAGDRDGAGEHSASSVAEEPSGEAATTEGSGDAADGSGDIADDKPGTAVKTVLEPGMAPAFIEPDFGVSEGALPGDFDDDSDAAPEKHDRR